VKSSRKYLSGQGLLSVIRDQFKKIKEPRELAPRSNLITLTDCLMSGLAVFALKFPSLLKFDESREERIIKHNLRTLYDVKQIPSDTYMRERCDEVDPNEVRKAYKKVFSHVQRGKALEEFEYLLKNHYLLAGDGTGFFSSNEVRCENCCVKHYGKCRVIIKIRMPTNLESIKKNTYVLVKSPIQPWELYYININKHKVKIDINEISGLQEIIFNKTRKELSKNDKTRINEVITAHYRKEHPDEQATYYHNMFCAAIVHPDKKIVLPLTPEPIMKIDGVEKNDCERNASKRLYADTRREHPHLKFIVVEDSLASNVPHLTDLKALDMRYIVGAKPGDHKFLFDLVNNSQCNEYNHKTDDGTTHRYRYINQVPLNKSNPDFKINFVEYWETDKNGEAQHFSWVTDIVITNENVYHIMKGGRSNWRIENNTFNTLKNQDYHFSHNFGHGYQNLCTVFGMLMMLAFLVDQVQELSCHLFKKARAKFKSRTSLWERIRGLFKEFLINSWDDLLCGIAHGHNEVQLIPNTS
jgi:hypothetical protein